MEESQHESLAILRPGEVVPIRRDQLRASPEGQHGSRQVVVGQAMIETPRSCMLGQRFVSALVFASQLHQTQRRKGTEIPYVSHLMSVSGLVLEDGGDEDEAIAGLLHDAVEDQGGKPTLEIIRSLFGDRVAHIVAECSDADTYPKPPWRWRKEQYIEHLQGADRSVLRVSLADKLHNARAILRDYRVLGTGLWGRFNAGQDDTLWYYRSILKVCRKRLGSPLVDDLDRTVTELEELIAADTGSRSVVRTDP